MAGADAGRGESVVDDILLVSEGEGEGARMMAVEGGAERSTAAQCAGGCQEVHPPGGAEEGGGQG